MSSGLLRERKAIDYAALATSEVLRRNKLRVAFAGAATANDVLVVDGVFCVNVVLHSATDGDVSFQGILWCLHNVQSIGDLCANVKRLISRRFDFAPIIFFLLVEPCLVFRGKLVALDLRVEVVGDDGVRLHG